MVIYNDGYLIFSAMSNTIDWEYIRWLINNEALSKIARNVEVVESNYYITYKVRGSIDELLDYLQIVLDVGSMPTLYRKEFIRCRYEVCRTILEHKRR
jgi:hypothetical protein